jgi:hypothetical protein
VQEGAAGRKTVERNRYYKIRNNVLIENIVVSNCESHRDLNEATVAQLS